MGFANTRRGARQLVNHGHITVDGKKVDMKQFEKNLDTNLFFKTLLP